MRDPKRSLLEEQLQLMTTAILAVELTRKSKKLTTKDLQRFEQEAATDQAQKIISQTPLKQVDYPTAHPKFARSNHSLYQPSQRPHIHHQKPPVEEQVQPRRGKQR